MLSLIYVHFNPNTQIQDEKKYVSSTVVSKVSSGKKKNKNPKELLTAVIKRGIYTLRRPLE